MESCFSLSSADSVVSHIHAKEGDIQPFANIATGRKTWKNLKKKKEAVWPPYVETVLLEALDKYRPASNRDVKQLQRFPKRNRYISDYILEATGKRRTAKQVGSRLQQLRDTCTDERVAKLLRRPDVVLEQSAPFHGTPSSDRCNSDSLAGSSIASSTASPDPTLLLHDLPEVPSSSHDFKRGIGRTGSPATLPILPILIYIELLQSRPHQVQHGFSDQYRHTHAGSLPIFSSELCGFFNIDSRSSSGLPSQESRSISIVAPNALWNFVPTVSFTSSQMLSPSHYHCMFNVFLDETRVHSEATEFVPLISDVERPRPFVYCTKLIPQYWKTLCQTTGQDLSGCTISQDIVKISHFPQDFPGAEDHNSIVFSVVYRFKQSYHIVQSSPCQEYIPSYRVAVSPEETPLPPGFPDIPILPPNSNVTPSQCYSWNIFPKHIFQPNELEPMPWAYPPENDGNLISSLPQLPASDNNHLTMLQAPLQIPFPDGLPDFSLPRFP
ncbi:hypothetical protein BDQ12DRAFT_722372 [Crucibulum laeve]|uniref:TEA domain-containing protein n=1 Tax=Crucibulum laeve TaxID=68775 RepID=A0A5C3M291_9AGAR|nr:hypothetical protein BDQ12DRAFT_722372 [Crucibulum laeve]